MALMRAVSASFRCLFLNSPWVGWVTWRLGELEQLAATACSDARHANVGLQAEHSHPKVVFTSPGCDFGYVLQWMSPHPPSAHP
jgi:hypothetical protein